MEEEAGGVTPEAFSHMHVFFFQLKKLNSVVVIFCLFV